MKNPEKLLDLLSQDARLSTAQLAAMTGSSEDEVVSQLKHYEKNGTILGYKAHMGAGSITSNVKSDKTLVVIKNGAEHIETGRKKVGAILGDYVEVGCNSVLNPGTVIGRESQIYPLSCVRGEVPERSIWKTGGVVVKKQ